MIGSFSININGSQYSVADVEYRGMQGLPGVGFNRLLLRIKILMKSLPAQPDESAALLRDLDGELFLHKTDPKSDILICRLHRTDSKDHLKPSQHRNHFDTVFEGELDRQRIHALEDFRCGGDLNFHLKLNADVVSMFKTHSQRGTTDLGFVANQSDWNKVLEGMSFRRTLLLEIPAPDEIDNPILADASKHLVKANEHLSRGEYRIAVAECRNVLESLKPILDKFKEIDDDGNQQVKGSKTLSKEQRIARVCGALKNLTHLAHHADKTSEFTEWKPVDAKSILTMTASLVRMVREA